MNSIRAFGKFQPGAPLPLRGFEVFFGIPSRQGPDSWKSNYPSIQNLLNHLARQSKSEGSRESYLNVIKRFCWTTSYGPEELISLPKAQIETLLQNYIDDKASEGKSRTTLNMYLKRLLTFYKVNGVENLQVQGFYQPTRYHSRKEYIPGKNEIYSMANAANRPRDRSIILCLWASGLRVSTFCALNYGDVREDIEAGHSVIKFPVFPEMRTRVPHACKGEIPYYSFICSSASESLRVYLRKRVEDFGGLENDDPLFHSDWNMWERSERSGMRLGRRGVGLIVKKSARLAGVQQWEHVFPHCLRKAFESVLRSSLVDGSRLDGGNQEFFMGHILPQSQDPYYNKTKVEYHRQEYSKLDFSLIRSTQISSDKLVPISELEAYFSNGWMFVSRISEVTAIVRRIR